MRLWVMCLLTMATLGSARLMEEDLLISWYQMTSSSAYVTFDTGTASRLVLPCHGGCCKCAWIRQPRTLVQGLQARLQTATGAGLTVQGLVQHGLQRLPHDFNSVRLCEHVCRSAHDC